MANHKLSRRDLKVPFQNIFVNQRQYEIAFEEHQKENLYRTYLYWPINTEWVLSAEGQYEKFYRLRRDTDFGDASQINTLSAPLSLSYFNTQGLFSSLIGTYVNQKIERENPSLIYENSTRENEGKEGFFLVVAVLGFRLPKRRGIVSFEARNLLDEQFLYRNANFYTSEATTPRFFPARTMLLRLTLNY